MKSMKISELAEASGESIPTIKFYIREGLLPAGESISRTQARYDGEHLRRLDLIRTLKNELSMSVEKIRAVLVEADQGGEALLAAGLAGAQESRHGMRKTSEDTAAPELGLAWALLTQTERELGWQIHPEDVAAADVAEAIATIVRAMPDARIEDTLSDYARAMKAIADQEIPDSFDPAGDPFESLRYAVLGTYLIEPLLLSLRRLAHGQRTAEITQRRPSKNCETDEPTPTQ